MVVEYKDKNANKVKKTIDLEDAGTHWTAGVTLSDMLDQEVSMRLYYNQGGHALLIQQQVIQVRNLGLVTSIPLVTDIASLIKRGTSKEPSPKDPEYRSSIPLSWAYNVNSKEGKHLAVTLPWMIGYNPRSAPGLADVIQVFPHFSAVFPLTTTGTESNTPATSDVTKPQMVVGAGVALFSKTFAFSWGVNITGDRHVNYLLIGLSAPDMVNAFK
jgi:hypothetical protein